MSIGQGFGNATDLQFQVDHLRAELAAEREKVKGLGYQLKLGDALFTSEQRQYKEQLAAAQATIANMREALESAKSLNELHGEIVFAGGGMSAVDRMNLVTSKLREALSAPTNFDQLHEDRARALAEAVKEFQPDRAYMGIEVGDSLADLAKAHRARKQATKEEGK